MKAEEREELVRYRLLCANEAIQEAEALMEKGLLRGSTNRLYYAMFYAVVALLATRDVYPKTHKGVRQQFSLTYLSTGLIAQELGLAYSELFERRHSGDYDDFVSIEAEAVQRLHAHTIALVDAIKGIIE